ncbi:MAG: cytochrome b/b6 domain-containing protein [Nitriliruptoraceae bacterium]
MGDEDPLSDASERDGYHPVAKVLHWSMVIALTLQFVVGYAIDRADDLLEWVVEAWLGGVEDRLVLVHAGLGLLILALACSRLAWRRIVGLPPWAPGLSDGERRVAHRVEQVLYLLLFLLPLSGLALLFLSGEDWDLGGGRRLRSPVEVIDDDVLLGAHIATQLAFFAALVVHVGLVLKHQLTDRDGLLRRML